MSADRRQSDGARARGVLRMALPFPRAVVVVIGLVAAVGLAACSNGSATSTTSTTTTTTPVPVTLPPVSVSRSEIEHAYMTLFKLTDPAIAPKLAVVQDGSTLKAAFTAAFHSALAKQAAGAKVLSIKIEQGDPCIKAVLPSPCAAVTYDILGPSGAPVLTGSSGSAVYLSSHWLVAKTTICTLLTLDAGGLAPPGC